MSEAKRKTATSTAVKRRYNDKTYKRFFADIRIEDYAEIDAFVRSKGWSKAEFIREAYDHLRAAEFRRTTSVYYTHSADSNIANVIICIDGLTWDFTEQLPAVEHCDSLNDRESGLIALISRWRDVGTLEMKFREINDAEKYPSAEISVRFPDAKKLK